MYIGWATVKLKSSKQSVKKIYFHLLLSQVVSYKKNTFKVDIFVHEKGHIVLDFVTKFTKK